MTCFSQQGDQRGLKNVDLLNKSQFLKTVICPSNILEKSLKFVCLKLYEPCIESGCKENHFYSLPFGQAEASIQQPRHHFNQPQNVLTSRIIVFTVLLLFEFLKKNHLSTGQVKNRIHQPNSKIHQPRAIGHYFLCTLRVVKQRSLRKGFFIVSLALLWRRQEVMEYHLIW